MKRCVWCIGRARSGIAFQADGMSYTMSLGVKLSTRTTRLDALCSCVPGTRQVRSLSAVSSDVLKFFEAVTVRAATTHSREDAHIPLLQRHLNVLAWAPLSSLTRK